MKKIILTVLLTAAALFIILAFFEFPLNLIRPVFHADAIERSAARNGLDPLLITSIIKVESNFLRRARSHRGAIGLMQVLPSTAQELAPELGYSAFSEADLEDPAANISFGSLYIKKLIDEFKGNIPLAIAAYNAGASKVRGWHRQNPMVAVEPDEIPYKETRNYVKNVLSTYNWLSRIQKFKRRLSAG